MFSPFAILMKRGSGEISVIKRGGGIVYRSRGGEVRLDGAIG